MKSYIRPLFQDLKALYPLRMLSILILFAENSVIVPRNKLLGYKKLGGNYTQKKMTKFIAVLSAALMVVCFIPSTFAAQDTIQRNSMDRAMHPEMNITWSANFSHENESFGTQQERMLEQINNTISKIKADVANVDGLENKNITTEMLDNATTQLEDAKTLVESAENVDDLKVAMEKVHTAMEELGIRPQDGPEMRREMMGNATGNATAFGNESFGTQQERMLEQINNTISKIKADAANVDGLENKNITAEMLDNATTQLQDAKTVVESAENVDDLKVAMEKVHTAMEELGIRPQNGPEMRREMMGNATGNATAFGNESFGTQQERMLEQINNTISKIKADATNVDGLENKNITAEMLDNATAQFEEVKTLVTNAENVDDLKVAMEKIHTAMEELGIRPENEKGMERGPMGKPGMPPQNETSKA